jgi:hypothetical protein
LLRSPGSADEPYCDSIFIDCHWPFVVRSYRTDKLHDQFLQRLWRHNCESNCVARNYNRHDLLEHRSDRLDDLLLRSESDGLRRQLCRIDAGQRNNAGSRAGCTCGADESDGDGNLFEPDQSVMDGEHDSRRDLSGLPERRANWHGQRHDLLCDWAGGFDDLQLYRESDQQRRDLGRSRTGHRNNASCANLRRSSARADGVDDNWSDFWFLDSELGWSNCAGELHS